MKLHNAAIRIAFSCLLLAAAQAASAQATRTWVSGVGDDVNPCSRTAPCKTFAGAISKTATGGEINVIDPGGFGTVNITKSMTIDGNGAHASILASGTSGIIINAGATGVVTLRNLSINGAGTSPGTIGIRIIAAKTVNIENVDIFGFMAGAPNGRGISDERNVATAQLNVRDVNVSESGRSGIVINTVLASLDNVSITGSGTGGLVALAGARATMRRSQVTGNVLGVSADGATTRIMLVDTTVANNSTGVGPVNTGMVMMSGTTVTRNSLGLDTAGGSILSYQDNQIDGNTTDGNPSSTLTLR